MFGFDQQINDSIKEQTKITVLLLNIFYKYLLSLVTFIDDKYILIDMNFKKSKYK